MSPDAGLVAAAEANIRADTGIIWDGHPGARPAPAPLQIPSPTCSHSPAPAAPGVAAPGAAAPARTDGAAYIHDGTIEGILTAVYLAMGARDAAADIVAAGSVQPRLGQEVVEAGTDIGHALKARRCLEYAQGPLAYHCIRAAAASDDPGAGTVIYRFFRHALAASGRRECFSCPRKAACKRACSMPASCTLLDDLATRAVRDLMEIYRAVMNERHKLEQFIRFEHREGDVWFARCNPGASVVPLVMDWFVARLNDQRFVIYDERHAVSGVYDGRRWYLVGGDAVAPPPPAADEPGMQRAWRRFYRCVSVEARLNPELRRSLMPVRFWRDLPELG